MVIKPEVEIFVVNCEDWSKPDEDEIIKVEVYGSICFLVTVDESFPIQNFNLKVKDANYMHIDGSKARSLKEMVPEGLDFETLFEITNNPDDTTEF